MKAIEKSLQKTDIIENHSSAYIRNGNWTHYFERDAVTNNLLALMFPPSGLELFEVETGSTYDDLHHYNDIAIDSGNELNYDTKRLPDQRTNAVSLYSKTYYTDGKHLLTTNNASYVVLNPDSFKQLPVTMTNEITEETTTTMLNQLATKYTPQMCATLYRLLSKGTPEEQLYMRASMKFDKERKKLTEAGELIDALNQDSNEAFIALFERTLKNDEHSKNGVLNLTGSYFADSSDIQYFIELNDDQSQIIFKTMFYKDSTLTLKDETHLPLSKAKALIKRVWFKTINHETTRNGEPVVLSLIEALHLIVYNKLWLKPKTFHNFNYTSLWFISRFYYYRDQEGK